MAWQSSTLGFRIEHMTFEQIRMHLALVLRLRQLRGRLPADFHFSRLEANEEVE